MRKDITITAEPRQSRGKNEARRLRARKLSPAILYGAGKEPVPVAVSPKEINKILHSSTGHNTVFNLDVQGAETTPVMIVDWQTDPVKDNLLHADLLRIDLARRLTVKVPVHYVGDARGVKTQGGLFEVVTREVTVECLPDEIPEHFSCDVTELLIGQSLRASDIALTGSMKLVSPADQVLVHIVGSRAGAETTEGAAPAPGATEPEVVKKGKKEEAAADKGGDKGKKK